MEPTEREHDELNELLASLANAVGRIETSDPDEHTWAEAMGLLGVLEGFLLKHLVREEENGYLAEALAAAPRLTRRAKRLLRQHDKISSDLDSLVSHARAAGDTRNAWEVVGAEARAFTRALRRHEMEENRLIQEAFMDDLGGGG